jgi:hypothetical protein
MKNCYDNNYDGAGMAWAGPGGLAVRKGYFSWKELWEDMRELEEHPVVLHCRLATQGSVKADNCHPFLLENGVAAAHNGMLRAKPLKPDMTDSESFAIRFIEPWTSRELRDRRVLRALEALISPGTMVMLDESGEFLFLNKEAGVESGGVWFSNNGFMFSAGRRRLLDFDADVFAEERLNLFPPGGAEDCSEEDWQEWRSVFGGARTGRRRERRQAEPRGPAGTRAPLLPFAPADGQTGANNE